jgi:hypothetical protein
VVKHEGWTGPSEAEKPLADEDSDSGIYDNPSPKRFKKIRTVDDDDDSPLPKVSKPLTKADKKKIPLTGRVKLKPKK